jgi:hypothetical protein
MVHLCETLHRDHLEECLVIGWDVTKLSDGKWVIVECNTNPLFIYPCRSYEEDKKISGKLVQWYCDKIRHEMT